MEVASVGPSNGRAKRKASGVGNAPVFEEEKKQKGKTTKKQKTRAARYPCSLRLSCCARSTLSVSQVRRPWLCLANALTHLKGLSAWKVRLYRWLPDA